MPKKWLLDGRDVSTSEDAEKTLENSAVQVAVDV
jgi:hypothetical protein